MLQLNFIEFIYHDAKVRTSWLWKIKTCILDRKAGTFSEPEFVLAGDPGGKRRVVMNWGPVEKEMTEEIPQWVTLQRTDLWGLSYRDISRDTCTVFLL